MGTYRLSNRFVWRLRLLVFGLFMMLWLAACQPASQNLAGAAPEPTATATATVAPTVTTTVAPTVTAVVAQTFPTGTVAAVTEGWLMYTNVQTGYGVEYPTNWTVNEQTSKDGSIITTFASPQGRASITVVVQAAPSDQTEPPQPPDLPNTRCEQVKIAAAFGISCFDTVALSRSTTLLFEKMIYTITTSGKGIDRDIYEHLVISFRPRMRGSS